MRSEQFDAIIDDLAHLPAQLTALQTGNPALQIQGVFPLGDEKVVIVSSTPV